MVEDVALCRRAFNDNGRLTCIVQNEAGKDNEIPRTSNGYLPKMAHVGIERLSPCHAEKRHRLLDT